MRMREGCALMLPLNLEAWPNIPFISDTELCQNSSPDAHAGQTRHSSHVTPLCTPQAVTLPYSHESGTAERRSTARSGARLHEYESVYECRQEDGGPSRRGTVITVVSLMSTRRCPSRSSRRVRVHAACSMRAGKASLPQQHLSASIAQRGCSSSRKGWHRRRAQRR